jgi:hypothetical protein
MRGTTTLSQSATIDMAVEILQQLSPQEFLKVISIVSPEVEHKLQQPEPGLNLECEPLYGLWKDLGFDVTAEDIDEVRKEVWKNFPREDIL